MTAGTPRRLVFLILAGAAFAQSPQNVLVVVNQASPASRRIGEYYLRKRGIPRANLCTLDVTAEETITRDIYDKGIAAPVAAFLKSRRLQDKVLYLVTTLGVPLRITGSAGMDGDQAAVDSELALLYLDMSGNKHPLRGPLRNPLFGRRDEPFRHPQVPIYLVCRLAGYDFEDVQGILDRAAAAANRGKFVIDLSSKDDRSGNDWLRNAAMLLPKGRVILDESGTVLYDQRDVIGYASWGSNDGNRKRRRLGFQWLPGAIATEYVSSNGRTFARPPENWTFTTWQDKEHWFAGSPQSLTADLLHEGASGASGHVYEPYLEFTPRPDYLLPAYAAGRNLAESYYLSIPALSWQNIVVGDPLCRLK